MRAKISQNLGVTRTEDQIDTEMKKVVAAKTLEIKGRHEWSYVTTDSSKSLPSSMKYVHAMYI